MTVNWVIEQTVTHADGLLSFEIAAGRDRLWYVRTCLNGQPLLGSDAFFEEKTARRALTDRWIDAITRAKIKRCQAV